MIGKLTCIAVLLTIGVLTPAASADESYKVTLNKSANIGTTEFRAGEYRIVVNGPKVVFTDVRSGKEVELGAKIENVEKKFGTTEVHTKQVDGVSHISEIRFGGSKTKMVFD